jgi:hypothetical protein
MSAPARRAVLRHRRLWILLGCAGSALIVYLSLTPSPHHVSAAFAAAGGDKVEHVLAFLVPVLYFGQLHPSARARAWIAAAWIAAGIGLEVGQRSLGGYADLEYGDMVASAVGVAVGVALLRTPLGRMLARVEAWLDRPAR